MAIYDGKKGKKRKGVHGKTKTSKLKTSKLYKKGYKGQGR
jgi:rubredoxin